MSYKTDDRGSIPQKQLYDMMSQLYPKYEIIYEFPLHEIGQRIDLFIPLLGIAVEYNGIQHYKYIEFFHKNPEGFSKSISLDKIKIDYLLNQGIKLIIIPFNNFPSSLEDLKKMIDSVPYPDSLYLIPDKKSPKKNLNLEQQRQKRKQYYTQYKQRIKQIK